VLQSSPKVCGNVSINFITNEQLYKQVRWHRKAPHRALSTLNVSSVKLLKHLTMKQIRKIQIVILLVIYYCLSGCGNKKVSMQPYDSYRLITSEEMINKVLNDKCIDTINFVPGDTIADIGAGDGRVEAMLSVLHDSLTFYVQDIDTSVCNQDTINNVISYFQGITQRTIKNKFIIVVGSDDKTNLPDKTFDKILMLWTYPYFKNPRAIMTDLKLKLKNDGLLYIVNPDHDYESGKQQTLEYGWNASPLDKEITNTIECGFELIKLSRNYEDPENPYIMVFKKKIQ
jgi:SAM-dependent methyltransferase